MKEWFRKLPNDEQARRKEFKKEFEPHYKSFRELPLGTARHISEHRTGVAPASVTISGRFGVIHIGNATEPIPLSEARQIDDRNLALLAKALPIQPKWEDFDIEGQPLFRACRKSSMVREPSWIKRITSRSKFMALRASPPRRPTLIGRDGLALPDWLRAQAEGHFPRSGELGECLHPTTFRYRSEARRTRPSHACIVASKKAILTSLLQTRSSIILSSTSQAT